VFRAAGAPRASVLVITFGAWITVLAVPIFCSPRVLAIVIGIVAHLKILRVKNDEDCSGGEDGLQSKKESR